MTESHEEKSEKKYALVTSARQLAPPPNLRKEVVEMDDWFNTDGDPIQFFVWELTGAEWADFMESGRVYTKDGVFKRYDTKDEDMRFLAHTIRDQHRNRIWPTVDAANGQLGQLGRTALLKLLNAANAANSPKAASAEKNSEETPTDS